MGFSKRNDRINGRKDILVCAWWCHEGNLGDEAIIINMITHFKEKIPNVNIIVLSRPHKETTCKNGVKYVPFTDEYLHRGNCLTKRLFSFLPGKRIRLFFYIIRCFVVFIGALLYKWSGINIIRDKSFRSLIVLLHQVHMLHLVGGGLLYDLRPTNIYICVLIIYLAKLFNVKVAMTGQGIGPIESGFHKFILKRGLNKADLITFRDFENSQKFLISIEVTKPQLITVGDDAISLPVVDKSLFNVQLNRIKRPILGVNFRLTNYYSGFPTRADRFAEILDQVVRRYRYALLFIPTSFRQFIDDRDAEKVLVSMMSETNNIQLITKKYSPSEMKTLIGQTNLFFGFSYHSLVFSLSQGIPSIGFYSEEYLRLKVVGLFDIFQMGRFAVDLKSVECEHLFSLIDEINHDKIYFKKHILKKAKEMSDRVEEVVDRIKTMVET